MLKVAKFGGSSMADAKQFEKVRDIVRADPARKVIVVSAAGKRSADDHKLTDLLYLCHAHLQYGVSCESIFQMICERYIAIRDECGLSVDIEAESTSTRIRPSIQSGMEAKSISGTSMSTPPTCAGSLMPSTTRENAPEKYAHPPMSRAKTVETTAPMRTDRASLMA